MDFSRSTVPHHEKIKVDYDVVKYRHISKERWNPFEDKPIETASEFCQVLRKLVNSDESRQVAVLEIMEKHPKPIIFYNYDYELDILKNIAYANAIEVAEWNGHKHQEVPDGEKWMYLVQYNAGAEGWNCIKTDTIIFYSQNYSYKIMTQASGRIDRMNTPYTDLYYYHLKSSSPIDRAISRALINKKKFNETKFYTEV
jgi:superfamily II DNA or RNA helicase